MLRQILGALAQWEKSALVYKLRKARDRKRATTGRCEGPLPFGELEGEGPAYRMLEAWRAGGHSYAQIAKWANHTGLKTRGGGPWNKAKVFNVLKK